MAKSKRTAVKSHALPVVDVVTQLATAYRHRSAAAIGAVAGGSIPMLASLLTHDELPRVWRSGNVALALAVLGVILGCAAFSMLTVARFGMAAFGDKRKAIGFVIALEGVMLVAHGAASLYALLLLVLVNAITNGCHIALSRAATLRRQAADARRATTAAQTRARKRQTPAPAPQPAPSAPDVIWLPRQVQARDAEFRMVS